MAWIQRYQAYWAVFHGSVGFVYGHKNLWTMTEAGTPWPEAREKIPGLASPDALDAPGSAHLMHLRALMESKPIQTRVPDQFITLSEYAGHRWHPVARFALRHP